MEPTIKPAAPCLTVAMIVQRAAAKPKKATCRGCGRLLALINNTIATNPVPPFPKILADGTKIATQRRINPIEARSLFSSRVIMTAISPAFRVERFPKLHSNLRHQHQRRQQHRTQLLGDLWLRLRAREN